MADHDLDRGRRYVVLYRGGKGNVLGFPVACSRCGIDGLIGLLIGG